MTRFSWLDGGIVGLYLLATMIALISSAFSARAPAVHWASYAL